MTIPLFSLVRATYLQLPLYDDLSHSILYIIIILLLHLPCRKPQARYNHNVCRMLCVVRVCGNMRLDAELLLLTSVAAPAQELVKDGARSGGGRHGRSGEAARLRAGVLALRRDDDSRVEGLPLFPWSFKLFVALSSSSLLAPSMKRRSNPALLQYTCLARPCPHVSRAFTSPFSLCNIRFLQ